MRCSSASMCPGIGMSALLMSVTVPFSCVSSARTYFISVRISMSVSWSLIGAFPSDMDA